MRINFVDDIWDGVTYEGEPPEPYNKILPPGSSTFAEDSKGRTSHLMMTCPCGCGKMAGIVIEREGERGWAWNTDKINPTFTPSILQSSGCKWHGFLTNGEFISV
jgi:hypothetical protein